MLAPLLFLGPAVAPNFFNSRIGTVDDEIHEKSKLHKRATHASAQSSPKAQFYSYSYSSLCMDLECKLFFSELEM